MATEHPETKTKTTPNAAEPQINIRVWDLPTRIFHWALAASVVALVITAQVGGNAMPWHFRLGYLVLSLLLFRIVWGLVGGYWSRFATFIYSPATILSYMRGRAQVHHNVGHNPLGAGSVFALLLVLLAQIGTGLMSDDEIAAAGPLTQFVSAATVNLSTWYHKEVGKKILIVLVILHLVAIGFYLFKKKDNLVKPMIHGDKKLPASIVASRDDLKSRLVALAVFICCAAVVGWGVQTLGR